MIKIIHKITGDCATKNTAKKGAGSYTRWNENGHVFVIDARGWGASRCGRRGRWSGLHLPPNTSECIIVAAAAVTAVRSKCTLPRDCGWVGERGWVE